VADLQWNTVQEEDKQNQQLLDLSHQILDLTKAVHDYAQARSNGTAAGPDPAGEGLPTTSRTKP
jgi:hypothetical protein